MILDDFKTWLAVNSSRMKQYGLCLCEKCESDDALILTYENEDFFTELTIRDTGFEDIEICDKKSEELHCMTDKPLVIDSFINNYLNYFDMYYKR